MDGSGDAKKTDTAKSVICAGLQFQTLIYGICCKDKTLHLHRRLGSKADLERERSYGEFQYVAQGCLIASTLNWQQSLACSFLFYYDIVSIP